MERNDNLPAETPTMVHPTAMQTNYNTDSVVDTNDDTYTAVSSIETNDRRINLKSSATARSKEKRLEEKQYNTDDTSCVYCGESSVRSNPPPLMSTAAMNGNNNYHSNHNNQNSIKSNGGTIKQPRNDDNDQYNCNYIDYFTNNLNYNEDRVYGGSYDDNVVHGYNNGHTKNNNPSADISNT